MLQCFYRYRIRATLLLWVPYILHMASGVLVAKKTKIDDSTPRSYIRETFESSAKVLVEKFAKRGLPSRTRSRRWTWKRRAASESNNTTRKRSKNFRYSIAIARKRRRNPENGESHPESRIGKSSRLETTGGSAKRIKRERYTDSLWTI